MNKMTVIQLLNKISKDEEVPKRIKYCGVYYKYDLYDYFNEDEDDEPLSSWIDFSKKDLNDEIEIIEDNGIKKLNEHIFVDDHSLVLKINEIIDKINLEE